MYLILEFELFVNFVIDLNVCLYMNVYDLYYLTLQAWTQYFYTVTWFWTLFYAIDSWLTIKGRDSHPVLYHSMAWGVPAATTSVGLSILYIPNAT